MVTTLTLSPGIVLDSADFGLGTHAGGPSGISVDYSLEIVGSGAEGDIANLYLTMRDPADQVTAVVEFELQFVLAQPAFEQSFDPAEDHSEVFLAPMQSSGNINFRDPLMPSSVIGVATEVSNTLVSKTTASYSAATGLVTYSYEILGVEEAMAFAFSQGPEQVTLGNGADYFCDPDGQVTLNAGAGNDTLVFEGSGLDSIIAGFGDDLVTIAGDGHFVVLGAGNDRLNWISSGAPAGTIVSTLNGGTGNDTVTGTNGADSFSESGGSGNDIYYGGQGTDTINASAATAAVSIDLGLGSSVTSLSGETDILSGIESARGTGFGDMLKGASSHNLLQGLAGNDSLYGLAGVDTLQGGDGNDLLVGGLRVDTLSGGLGDDGFVFLVADDSRNAVGLGVDLITDFGQSAGNDDVIDLSALDANATLPEDQALVLTGNGGKAGFTGAGGELRWSSGSGKTYVFVDLDGNLAVDFQITLTGTFTLTGSDFVL